MKFIDKLNEFIGHAVAWLVIIMVFGTLYNVIARYFFQQYSIPLGELVIIMNAMVFMLAAPLLLHADQHVRVDVFYSHFGPRGKALVDFFGTLFFLFPLCGFVLYYSWGYVVSSWKQMESSGQTGGLDGLYLVKSLIIAVIVLLILQGISIAVTKLRIIFHPELAASEEKHEESLL